MYVIRSGIIITAILPTFLIIGIGAVLDRLEGLDPGPLNTLTLFVLTPALTIHSIALTTLGADALLKISVGVVAFLACTLAVSWAVGKALQMEETFLNTFQRIASFGNTGALGIPLATFAFGDIGRQTAVLFAAVHGVFVYTIGLAIAANSGGQPGLESLRQVFRYPVVYAVLIAVAVRTIDIVPPAGAATMQTIGMLGNASIPVSSLFLASNSLIRNTIVSPRLLFHPRPLDFSSRPPSVLP
ncbi:AEC family transporter [Haladaptatus sp. DYF46]|uniref:AEC family transporter n=1 Tax=Haladaptatus sp. DYF46 TaxID=2886041 RepID=UPI001E6565E5|nr:AEC family transporter [Haladaptatus sp. DYF46]